MIKRYADRVGFDPEEREMFREGGHRVRHVNALARAAAKYSIVAEIVESSHCNAGHTAGQKLVMDVDGNFITELCPGRMCVYLASQLILPVALINERLSEGLTPGDTHGFRVVRCPDVGVRCLGYGSVTARVEVVKRIKKP